ncbi:class I adenylate-forming enzyme family protein [Nocardia sp. XZ_19_369]|uniref:class I adenylate-forming enzyme family protein n=1 Tax=Nocardia sp. XZ_19_369 TaxID=2769487 RepID=UPI00188F81C7|nr:AMP-binding protein [Nocardia sp. XZ_19_369]
MREQLLHDLLDRRAKLSPSKTALRSGDQTWSYGRLRQLSLGMHGYLRDLGVDRGDRVLSLASASAVAIPLVYACSRGGLVYVPVSPELKPQQLRLIIEDCRPAVVVVDAATAGLAEEAAYDVRRIDIDELADVHRRSSAGRHRAAISCDPVCLIYTSGSTAAPKGVLSTHAQVLFAVKAIQSRLSYTSNDRVLCVLPQSFDYGLYQAFLTTDVGATLCLEPRAAVGASILATLERTGATVLPCVPTLAQILRLAVARSGEPPARLRMITNTGAPLAPVVIQDLTNLIPGLAVVRMFGLTECKRVAIMPLDRLGERLDSVGYPLEDTECYVVDEDGNRLPPGQVGELVVRGANVMSGYWNAPELTKQRFRRNVMGETLLWTGDLCHLDDDGYLYHHGRIDEQYKQNGFRVSAAEIEAAALDISGVLQAALIPPHNGDQACLVVVREPDLAVRDVVAQLADRVERSKLPQRTVFRDTLPMSVNGKVDKRQLRESL